MDIAEDFGLNVTAAPTPPAAASWYILSVLIISVVLLVLVVVILICVILVLWRRRDGPWRWSNPLSVPERTMCMLNDVTTSHHLNLLRVACQSVQISKALRIPTGSSLLFTRVCFWER